jgi:hypothetical protein
VLVELFNKVIMQCNDIVSNDQQIDIVFRHSAS